MELYILRHAVAVPRGTPGFPNDDRPLTDEGREKMEKEARGLRGVVEKIDAILTSPLRRAHDTALIAARALGLEKRVETIRELLPEAGPEDLRMAIAARKGAKALLLVGHEPMLGLFAASLLGMRRPSIVFKKGGLCRIDADAGALLWHLTPKQLRLLADNHTRHDRKSPHKTAPVSRPARRRRGH